MAIKSIRGFNSKLLGSYLSRLLITVGVFFMIFGVTLSLDQQHQHTLAVKQAKASPVAPSTIKPGPNAFTSYTAPADYPRYISITKIGVKAIVRSLSLNKDNQIDSPANVYDTGWYNGSSKPGQPGAMLIDGHVSSWNANGVFYNLKLLKAGDTIQVERGDTSLINYTVVRSQSYEANNVDIPTILAPVNPNKPGLNIITCSGDVIKGTNDFSKRIVVFAEQI